MKNSCIKENKIMTNNAITNKTMTNSTITNATAEAVRNGRQPSAEELFELLNAYSLTMLSIQDKNHKDVMEMDVNYFDSYKTEYEFGQLNTDTKYIISQTDILSTESRFMENEDMIHIKCCLSGGGYLNFIIFHASNGLKYTDSKDYYEIGLYDLNEFLQKTSGDKPEYTCSMVKIKNKSGFEMMMVYPDKTVINMTDDANGQLNIADDVNFLKIDIMDDSCNHFYQKDNAASTELVIEPYNEPFMAVRMFFEKISQ